MHIHGLKKENNATHGYLMKLALQSRGEMLSVSRNTKCKKKWFANLFTNSETMVKRH